MVKSAEMAFAALGHGQFRQAGLLYAMHTINNVIQENRISEATSHAKHSEAPPMGVYYLRSDIVNKML